MVRLFLRHGDINATMQAKYPTPITVTPALCRVPAPLATLYRNSGRGVRLWAAALRAGCGGLSAWRRQVVTGFHTDGSWEMEGTMIKGLLPSYSCLVGDIANKRPLACIRRKYDESEK